MRRDSSPAVPDAARVLLTVPPPEIAYFHSILEGYDDLAVMRTLSAEEGLIEVHVSPGSGEEFAALLEALRDEGIPIRHVDEKKGHARS